MGKTTALTSLEFLVSLQDRMTPKMKGIQKSFTQMQKAANAGFNNLGKGALGMIGVGATISGLVNPALEDLKVAAEIKSLGVLDADFEKLSKAADSFAVKFGADDDEFVRSAASIKKAIPDVGNALADYTYDVNLLAKATGTSTEVTADYVGKMSVLFDGLAKKVGKKEWVDALTGMSAETSKIFNTNVDEISAAFNKLGVSATKSGISLAEQMAVIGSLQSTGLEGGKAGGAYKAFIDSAVAGGQKLGMVFTDSEGKMMPMVEIMGKLKAKFGDTLDMAEKAELTKNFGKGADVIMRMYDNTGRLTESIGKLNEASTGGMATAEQMAAARTNAFEQFGAQVNLLREAFGYLILKAVQPFMGLLTSMAQKLTSFGETYPNLAKWIGIITVSVIALTAAMSALYIITGICKMAQAGYLVVMTLMKAPMLIATAVQWAYNSALLACPLTWAIVAIAALAAAVVTLIYYWDDITGYLRETSIYKAFTNWIDACAGGLAYMGELLGSIGSLVGSVFGGVGNSFQWVYEMITKFAEKIASIPGISWIMEKIFGESAPAGNVTAAASPGPAKRGPRGVKALDDQGQLDVPAGGLTNNIGGNKTTSYGDVNIYSSGGMSPAQMEEWNALQV